MLEEIAFFICFPLLVAFIISVGMSVLFKHINPPVAILVATICLYNLLRDMLVWGSFEMI